MLTGDQCVGGDRYVFASDRHQQGAIIACTEGNGLAHGRQLREPAANERELIHVNSLTRAVQRLRISCGRIARARLSSTPLTNLEPSTAPNILASLLDSLTATFHRTYGRACRSKEAGTRDDRRAEERGVG